jgi:hypothetical protein
VVIALLVFAQVIPESKWTNLFVYVYVLFMFLNFFLFLYIAEHISVAIQDFLVCIEMVPFAIAHS